MSILDNKYNETVLIVMGKEYIIISLKESFLNSLFLIFYCFFMK